MFRVLNVLEDVIMFFCIVAAFFCGLMQVILRYVFNTGFHWTEGILIVFAIWACMMAGSRAVRDGHHVRVEIVADALPPRWKRAATIVAELVAIAFTCVLCYAGFLYTRFVWSLDAVSAEARIPEWAIYGVVPFSMACFALRHGQRLWRAITSAESEDEDLEDKMARSL